MTKEKTKILILVAALLLTLVAGIVLTFTTNPVYADTDNTSQIVNFNQLFDVDTIRSSYSNISFSHDGLTISVIGRNDNNYDNISLPLSDTGISLISGHKYFIRYSIESGSSSNITFGLREHGTQNLVFNGPIGFYVAAVSSVDVLFGVRRSSSYDIKFSFDIFDLSLMYGFGREPQSVESIDYLFPSSYPYNTGTLVNISSLSYQEGYDAGYNEGVLINDTNTLVFKNSLFNVTSSLTGINTLTCSINDNGSITYSGFQPGDLLYLTGAKLLKDHVYHIYIGGWETSDFNTDPIFYSFYIYSLDSSLNRDLFYWTGTGLYDYSFLYSSDDSYALAIMCTGTYLTLNNLVITQVGESYAEYSNAYDNGFYDGSLSKEKELTSYYNEQINTLKANYSEGGNGYIAIFNKGRNHESDVQNNFTFKRLFTALIEAPVQAILDAFDLDIPILDINLKSFILALFTTMVVIVILRVALAR